MPGPLLPFPPVPPPFTWAWPLRPSAQCTAFPPSSTHNSGPLHCLCFSPGTLFLTPSSTSCLSTHMTPPTPSHSSPCPLLCFPLTPTPWKWLTRLCYTSMYAHVTNVFQSGGGWVSKGGLRGCPGLPNTQVWQCHRSWQPQPRWDGKISPPLPSPGPVSPEPRRTCSWSLASLGSSEWTSSLTSAPVRHARCLGSSGQPGGSPCGAHGGSGGTQHQAWHRGRMRPRW